MTSNRKLALLEYARAARRRVARARGRDRGEAGDTLIEVLITLVIIGIASLALLLNFSTSITSSAQYANLATADSSLRGAMEEAIYLFQSQSTTVWASCPSLQALSGTALGAPSPGYTAAVSSVTSCTANSTVLVGVTVTSTASGKTQVISSIIYDPQPPVLPPPGTAAKIVFKQSPDLATAGSPFGVQPVVAIEDSSNVVVTSDWSSVALTITAGTGTSGATLSTTCRGSEFAGVVSFANCAINLTGTNYTLTATDGAFTAVSSVFNVTPGDPSQLVFTVSPSSAPLGTAFSIQPVVTVEDNYGNPVTTDNSTVTLSITSGTGASGAVLSGCVGNEFSGSVTFSGCSINLIGSNYTLTASDGALPTTASNTFNITSGPASKVIFTQNPSSSTAAGVPFSTQPQVTVEDSSGNAVVTDSSTVTLSIKSGTGTSGAVLSGCSGSEVSGVVTFTGCAINLAGANYQLIASDGALSPDTSSAFNITQPPATQLVFTTSPTGGITNTAFAVQPVVTVEDASGNPVTSDHSTVTLTLNSGSTQVPGCSQSESAGVVTFSGCQIASSGTYTILAKDGTLTPARSGSFNITGPASKVVFKTSPQDGAPGVVFSTQPVVWVEDSSNNIVTTDSSTVSLAIASGTGTSGAVLSGCSGSNTSGVVTFSGCSIDKAGANYQLKATDGSLSAGLSNSFNIAGLPYQLVFTTSPIAARGGSQQNFSTDPVIAVEDAAGNIVTSFTGTIGLTSSGGNLSSCNNLGASAGIISPQNCTFDGNTGTSYYLTATYNGLISGRSASFVPTGQNNQSPYMAIFTTSPVTGASGTRFTTQPVLQIENQRGNVVTNNTGASDTFSLSVSGGSGGTLSGCSGLTASHGIVNVSGCTFTGSVGTSYYITATDTSSTLTGGRPITSASFTVTS